MTVAERQVARSQKPGATFMPKTKLGEYVYSAPKPGTQRAKALALKMMKKRSPRRNYVIPPKLRATQNNLDPICTTCQRLTTRGGSCPGAAGNYTKKEMRYPNCHSRLIEYENAQGVSFPLTADR